MSKEAEEVSVFGSSKTTLPAVIERAAGGSKIDYREASGVGDQAPALHMAPGIEEDLNRDINTDKPPNFSHNTPEQKTDKKAKDPLISVSPQTPRNRAASLNDIFKTDFTIEKSAKRKRFYINSPEKTPKIEQKTSKEFLELIKGLVAQATKMEKYIKRSHNPKKEIKETAIRMGRTCEKLKDLGILEIDGSEMKIGEEPKQQDEQLHKLLVENENLKQINVELNEKQDLELQKIKNQYETLLKENEELQKKLNKNLYINT
ncbi:hypothetical protein ABEB36_013582 [Hypothenemus hampei]|uniref:Uncharacterized protein n=1 Tax=Hypothenemus hampei TaxID=57062 RepID=A0ABD1E4M8_HYPHA